MASRSEIADRAKDLRQALDDEEPTAAKLISPMAGMNNLPYHYPNDWPRRSPDASGSFFQTEGVLSSVHRRRF